MPQYDPLFKNLGYVFIALGALMIVALIYLPLRKHIKDAELIKRVTLKKKGVTDVR